MKFKKVILFIHRWLGFISGLVVFIVSITGCIFCFQDEIQDTIHSWRKVNAEHRAYMAPSVLKQTAINKYPGANGSYIIYYGKDRPAAVLLNVPVKGEVYVYINPYSGKVLHAEGLLENFFTVIQYIHLYLLLPVKIGRLVVGISVICFVVLLSTGMVLWWPKRKTDRRRSFSIKWNGKWKRVNYDLHNVLGFYVAGIALIISLTGLNITFEWMLKTTYNITNLGGSYPVEKASPLSDTSYFTFKSSTPVVDNAFSTAEARSPNAQMFLIYDDGVKKETINITAYRHSLHYGLSDYYYFDRFSGKLIKYLPYAKKSPGMKLNDLNYDLHVGQALNLPTKVTAFLASLVCASLPLTGVIIWFGKRKKSKQPGKAIVRKRHQRTINADK